MKRLETTPKNISLHKENFIHIANNKLYPFWTTKQLQTLTKVIILPIQQWIGVLASIGWHSKCKFIGIMKTLKRKPFPFKRAHLDDWIVECLIHSRDK
jgi:hypothetical protein